MCQDHAHLHHHGHQHDHHPGADGDVTDPRTLADKNREFWDDKADVYDKEDWAKQIIEYTSEQLVGHLGWTGVDWVRREAPEEKGKEVRVLDYACGPGPVSAALSPYATEILGLDISPQMVAKYNARFSTTTAHPSISISAAVGDIGAASPSPDPDPDSPLSSPTYSSFDIAVIGYALHHVSDPALYLSRLTERVKPRTGVVVVIDLLPFEMGMEDFPKHLKEHEAAHTIHKHGFDEGEMRALFDGAGLEDFKISILKEKVRMGKAGEHSVFFARGRRA